MHLCSIDLEIWYACLKNLFAQNFPSDAQLQNIHAQMESVFGPEKKIGAFHLERRESKPKAQVRMNEDIEMNPKADDSHPSTNEA